MKTSNVYFNIPKKRMTVCIAVELGTYNAAVTIAGLSQMLGAPAEQITGGEYKKLTEKYKNLTAPVLDEILKDTRHPQGG